MDERYSRQVLFAPIGRDGQEKLSHSHVLIVGAGALGTGNAEILVRAGVGKVLIADRDYVEWSNLQRQQLYTEDDAKNKIPKAIAAARRLKEVNSQVDVEGIVADVTPEEMEDFLRSRNVDLVVDATDNFDIRFIINDAAQKFNIPWIYGACVGSYGLTYTVIPGKTPCLSCLLESMPLGGETCDTVGVIGSAVQMVVSQQTAEALKILVGDEQALRGTLLSFDLWKNQYMSVNVNGMKRVDCPSCGNHPVYPYLSACSHPKTTVLCGRDTVQIRPVNGAKEDLEQLADRLSRQDSHIERNPYLVSFAIGKHRMVIFQDGRVLVHGTHDEAEAKSLYYRYVGG